VSDAPTAAAAAALPAAPPAPPGSDAGKLVILMVTAFVDMMGVLMVIPLLPFYVTRMAAGGLTLAGYHVGVGQLTALLVTAFTVAQLVSAPMWGRFSDRYGRRPALLIALAASAVAYVIFGFTTSLFVLFLSRVVQGAGGGTTGVIQAYVADATRPEDRAKSLGWLSAATNAGVALGPVIGSWSQRLGHRAPGLIAAALCVVNIVFAWTYLRESRQASGPPGRTARWARRGARGARCCAWSRTRASRRRGSSRSTRCRSAPSRASTRCWRSSSPTATGSRPRRSATSSPTWAC
jgi:multidrug resistance protein